MKRTFAIGAWLFALSAALSPPVESATIAAGYYHTVVRSSDGSVWAWGYNGYGQLGDGTTVQKTVPVQTSGLTGVTAVAAGVYHTLALKSDGTVWAFGYNGYGQLGDGTTTNRSAPVQVSGLTGVTAIAAGDNHSLAVKSDGTAWAWGYNFYGQLGDGTTTQRTTPVQVSGLTTATGAAGGSNHSLARLSDGTARSWGYNGNGQLGDGTTTQRTTPVQVSGLTSASAVEAGSNFTLAAKSDGTAWAWGYNGYGQLGDGTTTQRTTPVQVSALTGVSALGAGNLHSLAVKSDGSAWAWGYNGYGQLGDGTTTQRTAPVQVGSLSTIQAVTGGRYYHSAAVTTDGIVWTWGNNGYGQLGDGTTIQRSSPVQVSEAGYAWLVGTPTLSPGSGTYSNNQNVTVSCATSGATIHYTTNGLDPTTSDPTVASGSTVLVDRSLTLKARGFKTGMPSSNVASAVYTMKVATPTFSPAGGTYTTAQTVTISCATTGATVRYTTDGTDPTESSTAYTAPLSIGTTTTFKANGFRTNWTASDTATATYTMNFGTLAPPTMSPAGGSYVSSVDVTMTAAAGATIRYTTDGTDPTSSSTAYAAPVTVSVTTTLKAKAFKVDYTTSATTTNTYTIVVATPTFSPDGGTYAAGQAITVSTATAGATIGYTLTGVDPTTSDPVIASGGTLVAGNYTLKATAWKTGSTTSGVKSGGYAVTGSLTSGSAAGGAWHSIVAASDGAVWSWGDNSAVQLGDGTGTSRAVPGRVSGLTGVTSVAAGGNFSVALRNDGSVWTWGWNVSGQLGDGTTASRSSPVQVAISNVVGIAAGEYHVVVVKSDGTAWSWGSNGSGQLGDGTTTNRTTPVQVAGLTGVTAVAAGKSHSLAMKSDGTLWAWGANAYGQLGDGSTLGRLTPVRVDGLSGITATAAGPTSNHSLALRDDATVWTWGDNTWGQLGDGTTLQRLTPVRAGTLTGVTALRAGDRHSLALRNDGTLWAWGYNAWGQLGDGTTTNRPSPVQVSGLTDVTAMDAGASTSLAIASGGTVWAWGDNQYGQLGDGTTAARTSPRQIAETDFAWKVGTPTFSVVGGTYSASQTVTLSCATSGANIHYTTSGAEPTTSDPFVSSGGTVSVAQTLTLKAKGFKTGMPSSHTSSETYTLKPVTPTASPPGGSYTATQNVTLACATSGATIRYTTDGTDPTESSTAYSAPVFIGTTTTLKAKAFKAGWTASDTLTATYTLNLGALAAPTMSPAAGTYVGSVDVTMTGPAGATIRYTTDGTDPTASSTVYTGPVTLTVTTTVKAKAFDPSYAASATTTNAYTIKVASPTLSPAAGTYAIGQVVTASGPAGATLRYTVNGADPTSSDGIVPSGGLVLVATATVKARAFKTGCDPSDVVSAAYTITGTLPGGVVAAGGCHSLARDAAGSVWTWGQNASGQLGDGTTTQRTAPVPVTTLASVTALAGGDTHSLALKSDGTVSSFGNNAYGQLGDGTTTQRSTPVAVSGLSGVSAVGAGTWHSLAARSDGTAWSWGYNAYGQLGDGTTTQRTTPVQVASLTGVVAVAGGVHHSLALESDGTVWAFGYNAYGQLGDGTTLQRNTPVQVAGLTNVTAIAAGGYHSLAFKDDGTLWAWGYNAYGQLGDGTGTNRTTPVQVAGLTGVRAVAAGTWHTLASRADGSAWGWGQNASGELGDGTTTQRLSPVPVSGLAGIVAVAGGGSHGLAMDKDGGIWAWGRNNWGQVGDGTTVNRLVPVKLSDAAFAWKVATPTLTPAGGAYSASQSVTVACVTSGATIYYTTNGLDPTTSDPTVASGGTVTVDASLTLKARAFKTGMPSSNVAAETYTLQVIAPTASPSTGTYNTPQNVALSSATAGTTIRYTTDGTSPTESSAQYTAPILVDKTTTINAKAWKTGWTASGVTWATYTMKVGTPILSPGGGSYGAAQSVTVTCATPGAVIHYSTSRIEPSESDPVVASGGTVLVDRSSTLSAKAWKDSTWTVSDTASATYTLTLGTVATPAFTPGPGTYTAAQVVTISTSTSGATIRYTLDGSDPTWTSRPYLAPITIDWTTTVKAKAFKADFAPSAVATAIYTINVANTVEPVAFSPAPGAYPTTQTVTLTTSTAGALIHYTTNGNEPTQSDPSLASGGAVTVDRALSLKAKAFKAGMTASPVRRADYAITGAVAAAYQHGLALKADATVWAWGLNGNGQVGNGTTTAVTTPIQVLSNARAVAAVGDFYQGHSLAVKWDGTAWGWGDNAYGQLGDGTTTQRLSPVQVSGLSGVTAIAAGGYHTLALTSSGAVWAWGTNTSGQVGDGTTTQRLTPVQVTSLTDVVAIAAGYEHSLALGRDGSLWAWGQNSYGQLGDGTNAYRTTAVPVSLLRGVVAIAAGHYHSLALQTEGSGVGEVWSWGRNNSWQIGDGTNVSRNVPVRGVASVTAISGEASQSLSVRTDATLQGSVWGTGQHYGDTLTSGLTAWSTTPMRIGTGDFVSVAAGNQFSLALKRDTSIVSWGLGSYAAANGLVLGTSAGGDDPDGDGLTTAQEWALGTDPWNADTNGDGIKDGLAVASGKSATNPDMDGDGVANATEIAQGTDPFNADTDGDGANDLADCFPLDPTRTTCPSPTPGDTTPPVITLTEPTNATLISVVPPL